ncbi:MAG TPA: sigma-70 family RNA polymerase sigma factor [Thermoanaerobaculia bacterium]
MFNDRTFARQPDDEERELVGRLRAGDESAFDTFAQQYIAGLYRFALRRLDHDRELTREVVQSTVCKVIEKLDGYRAEAPLFTWLCACCRNEIAAHFRRAGRRPKEVELPEDIAQDQPESSDSTERVHAALDRLPPSYARAMEWRYLDGLDVAEIAKRLELTYKAAESLLSRARSAFRETYERLGEAPGPSRIPSTFAEEEVAQ